MANGQQQRLDFLDTYTPDDQQEELEGLEFDATDNLEEKLNLLRINRSDSPHARILRALWSMEWRIVTEIIAANENQSDTPRRIRELRSMFAFEVDQEGQSNESRYRLRSHRSGKIRRREYLTNAQKNG